MKFQARNNHIINWPEYPLLRITTCFIFGIYLSEIVNFSLQSILISSVALCLMVIFLATTFNGSRLVIRSLSSMFLFIGIALGVLRGDLQKGINHAQHYQKHVQSENFLTGRVLSEPKRKKRISTILEVSQINGKASTGKLLVYFSRRDSQISYQLGDVISIGGNVQRLKDNANPRAFNYKDHLKYKGIDFQIFLKDARHELIKSDDANLLAMTSVKIRQWALSIFKERLKDKDQLATASAMVLGYKDYLSEDLYTSFSETGAVHVLAVSGLHVGIICMIFIVFFDRFKSETWFFKVIKLATLLTAVWTYAMVTGASPAVLRAAVMFSLVLIGRLWFKGANIYNILAFSALIILLYDPYLLFQLSFQFSYLALISIVYFQPHIEKLYETKHWITTKIWQLTTVSIAAQILIFPISIYYFHKFPTYFILSGVAAVFLATFILALGILLLALNNIPLVGDIIAIAYSNLLEGFIRIIKGIQSLPFNNVEGVYISARSVILLYIMIGIIMFILSLKPKQYKDVFHKKHKRKRVSKVIFGSCILFLLFNNILYSHRISNLKELIVYDIYKDTAIDIFHSRNLHTIRSKSIDNKKEDFACKSYRIYNGNPTSISLNNKTRDSNQQLIVSKNGSLIFKNKHLILADRLNFEIDIPCESDILLVGNKTNLLPFKLLENHVTSLVVLDNSLSYRIKNHWVKECRKRNIDVHDIGEDGVFRI